ncbi:hypothetical protein F4821DRAFT_114255 [Hypoxylon rubiginosum]|uniref:Uncharacterized protein n=1 Tax=Hypoxylon rubiginosum TaxID=110542 RepID=A0ACC0DJR6_9PEZI|nr:hypothetical protein F4821DRAFT_114255 [Hypoxylon rubiginosum]
MPRKNRNFNGETASLRAAQDKASDEYRATIAEAKPRLATLDQEHKDAMAEAKRQLEKIEHEKAIAESSVKLKEHVKEYAKAMEESETKLRNLERERNAIEAYTRQHQKEMEEA